MEQMEQNEQSDLAGIILTKRLAIGDAPWLPVRKRDRDSAGASGAVCLAQQKADAPSQLPGDESCDADRKRSSRATAALVRGGYLLRSRARFASLTATGRRYARALAWPYTLAELAEAVRRLGERTAAGDATAAGYGTADGYVPETFIAGTAWGPSCDTGALACLDRLMLPVLRAGLVESASTRHGHVCYRLMSGPITADQLAELVDGDAADFRSDLADVYREQLTATRSATIATDAGGELGHLPIYLGLLRSHRKYDDVRGIEPLFAPAEAGANDATTSAASTM
jgi:hypothetical protein